ncbi:MAG: hypothetical protein PHS02_04605, partial [Candidatus ainarchaeum sp.]|nr:hypothetical protein [Candidatus ainarchaeum sp.]
MTNKSKEGGTQKGIKKPESTRSGYSKLKDVLNGPLPTDKELDALLEVICGTPQGIRAAPRVSEGDAREKQVEQKRKLKGLVLPTEAGFVNTVVTSNKALVKQIGYVVSTYRDIEKTLATLRMVQECKEFICEEDREGQRPAKKRIRSMGGAAVKINELLEKNEIGGQATKYEDHIFYCTIDNGLARIIERMKRISHVETELDGMRENCAALERTGNAIPVLIAAIHGTKIKAGDADRFDEALAKVLESVKGNAGNRIKKDAIILEGDDLERFVEIRKKLLTTPELKKIENRIKEVGRVFHT